MTYPSQNMRSPELGTACSFPSLTARPNAVPSPWLPHRPHWQNSSVCDFFCLCAALNCHGSRAMVCKADLRTPTSFHVSAPLRRPPPNPLHLGWVSFYLHDECLWLLSASWCTMAAQWQRLFACRVYFFVLFWQPHWHHAPDDCRPPTTTPPHHPPLPAVHASAADWTPGGAAPTTSTTTAATATTTASSLSSWMHQSSTGLWVQCTCSHRCFRGTLRRLRVHFSLELPSGTFVASGAPLYSQPHQPRSPQRKASAISALWEWYLGVHLFQPRNPPSGSPTTRPLGAAQLLLLKSFLCL